jgi:hypothetical protein
VTAFWWWWGAAAVFHVLGNRRWGQLWPDTTLLGVGTLVLLAAGLWLMVRPGDLRARVAVVVAIPLVALLETPVLSNHMWLGALVSVVALVARPGRDGWAARFVPAGRVALVGFYAFAAFAKLNDAFLDPAVSCAVVYADQALTAVGLPATAGPVRVALPWATLAVEASVPVLLVVRRTRWAGVVVASVFHILISFDLAQHFYDFTAVLVPLFLLFLWGTQLDAYARKGAELIAGPLRLVVPLALAVLGVLGIFTLGPMGDTIAVLAQVGPFLVWVPLAGLHLWLVLSVPRTSTGGVEAAPGPRLSAWAGMVAVAVVVVANGLSPYLEVKRVADFTMYANLSIVDGTTNHLLVTRSVPIGSATSDPLVILSSTDPVFEPYVGSGWVLPSRAVAAVPADARTVLARAGTVDPAVGLPEPLGWAATWSNRLAATRAIDTEEPTRCQTGFMPAN